MLKGGQDKTIRHTIFEKRIYLFIALYLMTMTVRATRCNGHVGAIALKISLGDSCSIGTVSVCGVWVILSVLWIAGSLVSDSIRCVVAGETFFLQILTA